MAYKWEDDRSLLTPIEDEADTNYVSLDEASVTAVAERISEAVEPMFQWLIDEVQSIRKLNKHKRPVALKVESENVIEQEHPAVSSAVAVLSVLPQQPFQTVEDIMEFDELLRHDPHVITSFEEDLNKINVQQHRFVSACWRRLMDDTLAQRFCWRGTDAKKSVRALTVAEAIKNVFTQHRNGTEKEFVATTKAFFQFAKARIKQKKFLQLQKSLQSGTFQPSI